MFKLARFLKPYKKQVIAGPIFKLIEAVFELIVPLVMANVIDIGVKNNDGPYIWRMGGLLLLLGVVGLCSTLVCQYFASIASQGFGTELRNKLFRHINTFSYAEVDKFGTPSLITRLTNDVNQMQQAVAMLIRLVIRAPFLAAGAIVMAMLLDLKMSLIFLVAAPFLAGVIFLVMNRSIPFYRGIQKKLDRISLISRENLSGARVIRAFSKQESEKERFQQASDDLSKTAIRVGKISALLNPATTVILNIAIIGIVWYGGRRVQIGDLSQGEIIAFVNYINQILLAMIVIANLVVLFTKASASAARINEVLETMPSIVETAEKPVNVPLEADTPKVEFQNVSFAYAGSDEYSLEDIQLQIRRGETIGVIGGTGSGKSTLINLIPRFYEATKGAVLVDGVNVKEYPFEQLRTQIGLVPQKATLFSGTIRENLQWRKENATDEEIARALSIAQASEFVDALPEKYDAVIDQGGKNLSGGQKQRLTIARALVGEPELLILDDSASALDFATDAALRQAIRRETKNMTVILVSQRASTIRNANQIVVLDDGRVAGIGTHQQLMSTCETYREICLSQLSSEEVGA